MAGWWGRYGNSVSDVEVWGRDWWEVFVMRN